MKYPKDIQKIMDKPSCLPKIEKMIKKNDLEVENMVEESEIKLRRILNVQ